jgi:hypothetical protein
MSFLTGTHRFLDPKCNEILDKFYECIEKKTRAIGACDGLLAQLYRCKKEDVRICTLTIDFLLKIKIQF